MPENRVPDSNGTVIAFPGTGSGPSSGQVIDAGMVRSIQALRQLLSQSLLDPRRDVDQACMLIAADHETTVERYAAAFFHGIEAYARRSLQFFTVKADTVSDDEMWLLRLLQSLDSGDYASARYLMALRIEPAGHRRLMFLAQGLARALHGASPPISSTGMQHASKPEE